MSLLSRLVLVVLAVAGIAVRADAQCADGSPPPCPVVRRPVATAIDPTKVAILPFRVTTADSLLGEGLAELVATEFAGGTGPRAVHMGNVLRAWRRAGGGLRSPLAQDEGRRVARGLGAGLLIEGSVVGLGQRLRINASITNVVTSSSRRIEAIAGSADSLEVLVRRLSAGLLAASGNSVTRNANVQSLTDSPEAMRAYLEGLSHWRQNRVANAMDAFERAWKADTMFAAAAFMSFRMGNWVQAPGNGTWAGRSLALRHRMSAEDRLLSVAFFGDTLPTAPPLTPYEYRRRVASALPESPDAQYLLGDWLLHWGMFSGVSDWQRLASIHLDRALKLDSLAPILAHALQLALIESDTARAKAVMATLERQSDAPGDWALAWLTAGRIGDQARLAELRREATGQGRTPSVHLVGHYGLSAALTDEAFDIAMRHGTEAARIGATHSYWLAATIQGRPRAALRVRPIPAGDTLRGDALMIQAALFSDADSASGAVAVRRLVAQPPREGPARAAVACALGLWYARMGGETMPHETTLAGLRAEKCRVAVAVAAASRAGAVPDSLLEQADSLVRTPGAHGIVSITGTERFVVAREWERRGQWQRALSAVRAKSGFQGIEWTLAQDLRLEGRYAVAAGDTAAAVAAYRRYLQVRGDVEPSLVPQRDSVRSELARLRR